MTNRELIDAARSGDQAAFTELYKTTYREVYDTVRFPVKDEDAVQDILQDSYIKAFGSLDQLQDADKFQPWIKRIARNKAVDYLRNQNPIVFSALSKEENEGILDFADDRTDNLPDIAMDRKETARLLDEILDEIPEDQRICITMYYYDQLSVKEIAGELDLPEATVKSRMQYGRRRIQEKVRELEKKDTRLYGVAPIPFFTWLLREQAGKGILADPNLLSKILENMQVSEGIAGSGGETMSGSTAGAGGSSAAGEGAAAGTSAASSAAGSYAAAAGAAAGKALATKVIAGVLAVGLIGGGGYAVHKMNAAPKDKPPVQAAEPPVPDEPPVPKDADKEEAAEEQMDPTDSTDQAAYNINDVYQQILDGYQECMSEGLDGDSQYLQYEWVRHTLEYKQSDEYSMRVVYALHDVNNDGVKELVMGQEEGFTTSGEMHFDTVPFEIYAMDGGEAKALFQGILGEIETLHIGDGDGYLWIDAGNSGMSPRRFYTLPEGSAEVQPWDGPEPEATDVRWNGTIEYHSILESVENFLK